MSNESANGGSRILDLVNRIEPFEFDFDGLTLKGEWYKYRTNTPKYRAAREMQVAVAQAKMDALPTQFNDIADEAEREAAKDKAFKELRNEFAVIAGTYFTDTIKSWNAVDDNGPIPISIEVFEGLPEVFTEALAKHFRTLRDQVVNPTKPPNSPSG